MTVHILGASHTGADALWHALSERLGPLAGHLHPPAALPDGAPNPPTPPPGACRTWSVESENWPQRGQFLPDLQPHSPAMGQKDGEKWTAAVNLQPTISKSDRLLVLLMGLDWPCPAAEAPLRAEQDAHLRQGLALRGMAYRVLYGSLERRLASVLAALGEDKLPQPPPAIAESTALATGTGHNPDTRARLRAWGCEKCSDPVCEHRLFTSLKLTAQA